MNKAEIAELERVFVHDIELATSDGFVSPLAPLRRNKHVRKLIEEGLLVEVEATISDFKDGLGSMKVRGLELTLAGYMAYCLCADDQDDEEIEP